MVILHIDMYELKVPLTMYSYTSYNAGVTKVNVQAGGQVYDVIAMNPFF